MIFTDYARNLAATCSLSRRRATARARRENKGAERGPMRPREQTSRMLRDDAAACSSLAAGCDVWCNERAYASVCIHDTCDARRKRAPTRPAAVVHVLARRSMRTRAACTAISHRPKRNGRVRLKLCFDNASFDIVIYSNAIYDVNLSCSFVMNNRLYGRLRDKHECTMNFRFFSILFYLSGRNLFRKKTFSRQITD